MVQVYTTINYDKKEMQWLVKFGRLTIFVTDNYETAKEFALQYQADADQEGRQNGRTI